jgi:hypothetical protein
LADDGEVAAVVATVGESQPDLVLGTRQRRADHFEFLSRLRLCGKTGSGQDERGQECDKQQLDKSFHENLR